MILFAVVLSVLGASSAMAQKIYRAEVDASMFKAWTSPEPGATEVAEPEAIDGGAAEFGCESNLYREISAGGVVFGNTNVYYLWYADLTGSKQMIINGTKGVQLRVLLNRPAPEEGGSDAHGGQTVEKNVTIADNGEAVLDLTDLSYVHLNCIKLGWGSPAGVINSIEVVGTVKPVTGILSMINNGDAEGDDVSSFPVSYDGPNNGGTANDKPEIVAGGVNDSRCFKVTAFDAPSETWHTQFYIKSDEVLEKGTKYVLKMSVKADVETTITTSAQAAPRTWKGGFIDEFPVNTEWKDYTWTGEINTDDFQSIAFDLNNNAGSPGNEGATFYFDNIEFGVDLGGNNPMSAVKGLYSFDVIRIDLGGTTNMKKLVAAASGGKTLIYPNELGTVLYNGKEINILSIEGRPDGNLYIFMADMDGEGGESFGDEDAQVVVAFKNPSDAEHQIIFEQGKFEGQAMPELSGIVCAYDDNPDSDLYEYYSYLYGTPQLESAEPEIGSFNLPGDLKEFVVNFTSPVIVKDLSAKLGNEVLTVTAESEFAKTIKLTRTATGDLAGELTLHLIKVVGQHQDTNIEEPANYDLPYSFGKIVVDPNDQPKDILDLTAWNETADGGIPAGYMIKYGSEEQPRTAGNTYGSGARMFAFGEGGDFTRGLYFREGYVTYGMDESEDYKLTLEANKKYYVRFNSAMWKDNGPTVKFQIFSADDVEVADPIVETVFSDDDALYTETVENTPNVNGSKDAVSGSTFTEVGFVPTKAGNYILRWSVDGFNEVLLANPVVKYIPSTLGVEEMALLETALENAKATRDGNSDERYNGTAFDALVSAINKYEAEKEGYTAPSSYKNAAAALDAASQAMKDHRNLCDTYDPLPAKGYEVLEKNAEKKFAVTEIYANLKAVVDTYVQITTEKQVDPETGEEYDVEVVGAKPLKDDAQLTAATTALQENIELANGWFTEGASAVGDWSATRTGYAVLVDRIRQGAEGLKALGVADDDELIVAANNALSDDDVLATSIKKRITLELYQKLADPENTVFDTYVDENTMEDVTPTYNFTVFAKNPNLYKISDGNGYKEGAVPGWDVVDGRGFSTGWNEYGSAKIPVDAMFSNWGGSFTVSQTIVDLPAGVYTLKAGYGERYGESDITWDMDESFFYAKTTDMGEDSVTASAPSIGQAFPDINSDAAPTLEEVVVTDGLLTLGVQAGNESHVFFDAVKIFINGAAPGFDYGKGYTEDINDAKASKVRAVALYDLNGRRIMTAQKGVQIVKKYMSDGTVRTEKVVKK